jgi:hypothetical protein
VGAADSDDEGALAPGRVGGVGEAAPEQDLVVDADRVQVTGPDPEQGVAAGAGVTGLDGETRPVPLARPDELAGGEQDGFPRLRGGGEAE